jgi:hypothetical protein
VFEDEGDRAVSADSNIREGFLDPAVALEAGACPAPQVLWHAARGDLRADAMGEVLDHLALCGACTEDYRLVRQVAQEEPRTAAAPGLLARLAAAIVAPAPALAYLVLVCVCLALLATRRPAEVAPSSSSAPAPVAVPSEIAALLPEVRLTGDAATRGEGSGARPVALAADRVLLRLFLDEPPSEAGAGESLRVRVSAGEAVLWEEELLAGALAPDGSLPLVLDLSSREAGETVKVAIDRVAPDGRADRLFEQTLRVGD